MELLEGAERLQGGWCHRGLFQGLDGLGVFPRPDQEDGPLENASSLLGLLFDLCGVAVAKVELGYHGTELVHRFAFLLGLEELFGFCVPDAADVELVETLVGVPLVDVLAAAGCGSLL